MLFRAPRKRVIATVNLSRIDSAILMLSLKKHQTVGEGVNVGGQLSNVKTEDKTVYQVKENTQLNVYAVNYNVLRIMSGGKFWRENFGGRFEFEFEFRSYRQLMPEFAVKRKLVARRDVFIMPPTTAATPAHCGNRLKPRAQSSSPKGRGGPANHWGTVTVAWMIQWPIRSPSPTCFKEFREFKEAHGGRFRESMPVGILPTKVEESLRSSPSARESLRDQKDGRPRVCQLRKTQNKNSFGHTGRKTGKTKKMGKWVLFWVLERRRTGSKTRAIHIQNIAVFLSCLAGILFAHVISHGFLRYDCCRLSGGAAHAGHSPDPHWPQERAGGWHPVRPEQVSCLTTQKQKKETQKINVCEV